MVAGLGYAGYQKWKPVDLNQLTQYINNRQFDLAKTEVDRLSGLQSKDTLLLILTGKTYLGLASQESDKQTKTGYLNNALFAFMRAEAIDQNIVEVYRGIATVYQSVGKFDLAENNFKKALVLNSDNVSIIDDLANLDLITGNILNASSYYSQALKLDKNDIEARIGVTKILVSQRNYPQADRLGRSIYFSTIDPGVKSRVGELLGQIELKLNNYPEAQKFFAEALNLNPKSVYAAYGLAETEFDQKFTLSNKGMTTAYARASELAKKAIAIDSTYPYPYILLTRIASASQDKTSYDMYVDQAKKAIGSYIYMTAGTKKEQLALLPAFQPDFSTDVKIKIVTKRTTTTPITQGVGSKK